MSIAPAMPVAMTTVIIIAMATVPATIPPAVSIMATMAAMLVPSVIIAEGQRQERIRATIHWARMMEAITAIPAGFKRVALHINNTFT